MEGKRGVQEVKKPQWLVGWGYFSQREGRQRTQGLVGKGRMRMALEKFEVLLVDPGTAVQQAVGNVESGTLQKAWGSNISKTSLITEFSFLTEYFLNSNAWLINQTCMGICDKALLVVILLKKTKKKKKKSRPTWGKERNWHLYAESFHCPEL